MKKILITIIGLTLLFFSSNSLACNCEDFHLIYRANTTAIFPNLERFSREHQTTEFIHERHSSRQAIEKSEWR